MLVLEATLALAVAGIATATLPFRHVGQLAARPISKADRSHQSRLEQVGRVRWSIHVSARRVPWHVRCFQQGLAAQFMLRRRGVPAVLYYGAATKEEGLGAHVWVRDGEMDVIGCEIASRYAVLATFPPESAI